MNTDKEKLLIAEQAAEWLIRLETATEEERAEFWRWLSQSPLHVREMLAAQACQIQLAQLFRDWHMDVDTFVQSTDNVRELTGSDGSPTQHDTPLAVPDSRVARWRAALIETKRTTWMAAAAATAFIALLAVVSVAIQSSSDRSVVTHASEWQTRTLSDGTIVQAGPRTSLLIEFTGERRVVRLIHGEALFNVAHNPRRAFLVETQLATARAVGTAFAVSLDSSKQVRVTVKEGVVEVARHAYPRARQPMANDAAQLIRLKAGEQISVTDAGPLTAGHVNVDTELAWANGRLIFEHETVEQAVREFNRRNKIQLKVVDASLLSRPIRGVFAAADPKYFAAFLERQGAVSVVDAGSETLLISSYPSNTEKAVRR